jgi:hypothetical protein
MDCLRWPAQETAGRTAECQIQVRAEEILQQGVQREYHLYNCADSPLRHTANLIRTCLIDPLPATPPSHPRRTFWVDLRQVPFPGSKDHAWPWEVREP